MTILVTGGTGYIASHVALQLIYAGEKIVLYDNLSNSSASVAQSIARISNQKVDFVQGDIRDSSLLDSTIKQYQCTAVMHFAGLKAVGESVKRPLSYFNNNLTGAISLLETMQHNQVRNLVFSSSATVYGDPKYLPLDEAHPTSATNPYGRTKLHIEEMLSDLCIANPDFSAMCLRYFNPTGAHPSSQIGELSTGVPNNLMPFIAQTAAGIREQVEVFGNDYPTPDGTGIRDYIHIEDLASGHLKALDYTRNNSGWQAINLGTGRGYSVLEAIAHFSKACGREIPHTIAPRRAGDVASCYASVNKAYQLLNWQAKHDLASMCQSAWRWQQHLIQQPAI